MRKILISPEAGLKNFGPVCLHSIYKYYNDPISLEEVISEVKTLSNGGTLNVILANHALRRGYNATIYTYNVSLFDPSWFPMTKASEMIGRLEAQLKVKNDQRLQSASMAYIEFLKLGGVVKFRDLNRGLFDTLFKKGNPILAGLSSTYLYENKRKIRTADEAPIVDDINGLPVGHFVIINRYDKNRDYISIVDPFQSNLLLDHKPFTVNTQRLINSIMLGILTYDASLLILKPRKHKRNFNIINRNFDNNE